MKGFLITLLLFIFWASCGVYYISQKSRDKEVTRNPYKYSKNVEQKSILIDNSIDAASSETNDTKDNFKNELDTLVVANTSPANSQVLAAELKKSITISDTIDIDAGEPAIAYENEILFKNETETNKQYFYPQYTASSELILDKKLVEYSKVLKQLVQNNPNIKITIIGHTDNIGNARDNFTAGLKKARQVKWYLSTQIGIPRKFITATSRGEEEPIEDNTSNSGRNKNNRIEIIVD